MKRTKDERRKTNSSFALQPSSSVLGPSSFFRFRVEWPPTIRSAAPEGRSIMATSVIVTPRFQAAAKKLPVADSRILGEFLRLVVVLGVNPLSAASSAHAHSRPLQPADKALAYGG